MNMYIYRPLLHNAMSECGLFIDVYLGNSTRPVMSTFADVSTQRVNVKYLKQCFMHNITGRRK